MQYVVSIASRYPQVLRKGKDGTVIEQQHVAVTHVPVHNRGHAELIADAINSAVSNDYALNQDLTYQADVAVRVWAQRGSVVLPLYRVDELCEQWLIDRQAFSPITKAK